MTVTCPCCDTKFDPEKGGKPRSYDQHKRYFALIRGFFFHWPETHDRQFSSEAEFRSWAQMKAGYREIAATIPLAGVQRERALILAEAAIRACGSYAFPILHGGDLVVFRPKSIAFAKLSHKDACKLFDAVQTVLEQESGIRAEAILTEKAA
jgi:hypothetical protein